MNATTQRIKAYGENIWSFLSNNDRPLAFFMALFALIVSAFTLYIQFLHHSYKLTYSSNPTLLKSDSGDPNNVYCDVFVSNSGNTNFTITDVACLVTFDKSQPLWIYPKEGGGDINLSLKSGESYCFKLSRSDLASEWSKHKDFPKIAIRIAGFDAKGNGLNLYKAYDPIIETLSVSSDNGSPLLNPLRPKTVNTEHWYTLW